MPQFAEVVIDEQAGFVSPTVVPQAPAAPDDPAPELAPEEGEAASASDIIAPAGGAPQESPPGS
jgi:hypothetical protein